MSYLLRLRPASFVAPDGEEIDFQVDSLERSGGKKGATQEILDSGESISQDLGNQTTVYSISAYFPGADYDLATDIFFQALEQQYSQAVPGILKHPRWGNIPVFPFTWSQSEELISGSQIGRIQVTFRRVFPQRYPFTDGRSLEDALQNLDGAAAESLEAAKKIDLTDAQAAANFAGKMKAGITAISNTISDASDTFNNIQNTVNGLIDDVAGNIFEIVAGTQRLIRAPGRFIDQTRNKINGYADMIESVSGVFNDIAETDPINRLNNAIALQLFVLFGVGATAEAAAFTNYSTRESAVDAVELILDVNDTFNNNFDEARTSGTVSEEFSGDHNIFSLINDTTARINDIIINQAFDLKAEKRFILKNNSDAVNECYKAYGTVSTEQMEFFIESNKLKNNEFLDIPAGREIVIYV